MNHLGRELKPSVDGATVCRRYPSVHIAAIGPVYIGSHTRGQSGLAWALAGTDRGEYEVVGVWLCSQSDVQPATSVALGWKGRGLESIGIALGPAWLLRGCGIEAVFPTALLVARSRSREPHTEKALRHVSLAPSQRPVEVCIPRSRGAPLKAGGASLCADKFLREKLEQTDLVADQAPRAPRTSLFCMGRAALRGEETAARVGAGAAAALRRHGPFDNGRAAVAFVEAWLRAAERRIALEAVSSPRPLRGAVARVSAASWVAVA
jgi:hypothetical protein